MTAAKMNPGSGKEAIKHTSSLTVKSRKPKALVIDEDYTCRAIVRAFVCSLDIETDAVEKSSQALDLIASGATFDYILIEKTVKNPSGLETVRQMRAVGVQSRIVAIAVEYSDAERNALLAAGAALCIEKPVTPVILARALALVPDE